MGIKQLSTVYLFHPNALHTRFHHSLGVATLLRYFLGSLPFDFVQNMGFENQLLLTLAGLLHDIGHSAWSHVGEVFPQYYGKKRAHDELSAKLVEGDTRYDTYFKDSSLPRVRDILRDDEAERVAELIRGKPPISKTLLRKIQKEENQIKKKEELANEFQWMGNLIEGPMDFDTADFLRRDALYTLANPGLVDPYNIAKNVGVEKTAGVSELVFLSLPFAESFLLAPELMYPAVYVESQNLLAEELLLRAFMKTYDEQKIDDFWFSTDEEVLNDMKDSKDKFVQRVVGLMRDRRTYNLVLDMPFSKITHTTIISNLKSLFDKRYGLLQLENHIVEECKGKGYTINVDDIVVSTWVWHTEKIPHAKIRIKEGECVPLAVESELVDELTRSKYPLSRSKVVIGTYGLSGDENNAVIKATLSLLKDRQYPC